MVFDTSSLISAALRVGSIPSRALRRALAEWEVRACRESLAELEVVLRRKHLERYLPESDRSRFVAWYRGGVTVFSVGDSDLIRLSPRCRDPKDNVFLALARTAQATVIVSSDNDLLVLHPWQGIAILTPAQFLAQSDSD